MAADKCPMAVVRQVTAVAVRTAEASFDELVQATALWAMAGREIN